jgi:uncharacterized protein YndB with AHSA1/START domain
MKTIKKVIDIRTTKENVWKVLTEDQYVRQWYTAFSEGARAETDWKVGSKVLFVDGTGCGLIGKIIQNKPNELLSVEYTGMMLNGKEDYEQEDSVAVKGGHETYALLQKGDTTELAIAGDMSDSMYDAMSALWDDALLKLKSVAEGIKN